MSAYDDPGGCNCNMEYLHINDRLNNVEKKVDDLEAIINDDLSPLDIRMSLMGEKDMSKSNGGRYGYQCKACQTWNNFEKEVTMFRCCYCNLVNELLPDNPEPDWQELKIDDLPRDICKEVDGRSIYEFQSFGSSIFMNKIWIPVDAKVVFILEDAKFKKYRFRKRQPDKEEQSKIEHAICTIAETFSISHKEAETKLNFLIEEFGEEKKAVSHDEFAEEYTKNTFPTTNEAINFPAAYSLLKSKRRIAFMAFIAGRESK